jgi:hypothetical protein
VKVNHWQDPAKTSIDRYFQWVFVPLVVRLRAQYLIRQPISKQPSAVFQTWPSQSFRQQTCKMGSEASLSEEAGGGASRAKRSSIRFSELCSLACALPAAQKARWSWAPLCVIKPHQERTPVWPMSLARFDMKRGVYHVISFSSHVSETLSKRICFLLLRIDGFAEWYSRGVQW